ncbi:MFS general substrate transporter [Dichomitus squalens LYAD-421 SS1]|uniref:MFS general substrate transporter n=1 Tax=Dichomitus squalens (strain LYAD-421) TaxID=732165 RepID=R7SR84_DICSQ|nr:MFS general substrate transporter [Dichomitus squalens LYAD-421 SS1]EJF58463.1 MFS general substrate transporter [Dichomitus squalens LYAD-421 SS1]
MPSNDSVTSRSASTGAPSKPTGAKLARKRPPWALHWRSSMWFITLAVGIGVTTDILVYSMIVPVLPFRLQDLGYADVSGLVGWLLFAYSAAIVISTPFIAYLSERFKNRRVPLLCGLVALIGSQIMLMEAPTYWVMALARVLQGISGSVIWVVGLALVCDTVPEAVVGKQLGFVMIGMSLGFLVGPPVAGALDNRFGFRGPFIFGVIVTSIEFIWRLLIIERKDAVQWDASLGSLVESSNAARERVVAYGATTEARKSEERTSEVPTQTVSENGAVVAEAASRVCAALPAATDVEFQAQLSILGLLLTLIKSSRAMAPVLLTLAYGVVMTSQEPALPLYLHSAYSFGVSKVGLIYIAAVVPSFISSPLAGWYADHSGTVTSTLICLLCSLPFWILIAFKGNVAYFIAMFAFLNFFVAALVSPITAELAAVTRSLEGVGYGHVYGAFNMAYGVGSAVGPVIGGQLYDHVPRGWMAICLFDAGLVVICTFITVCFFGDPTALRSISTYLRTRRRWSEQRNGMTAA